VAAGGVIDLKRLVVNCRSVRPDGVNVIYVGRPSPFGNPFSHEDGTLAQFKVATRAEAIARFEDYLLASSELQALLPALRGKRLACWCAPYPCHAEVLALYANRPG
jgi:hypothetical protein